MGKLLTREHLLLLFFILLKFILHYQLINDGYDLHRDEYLHLDQGKHLAWGYLSVPPVTSWFSWLILWFGGGVFWVKFFPALFGALTIVVVWRIAETLGGGLYAKSLAALATTFSVILRLNILYQPNSFDVLMWTALFYCAVSFFKTEERKWLFWAALVFGIGFLNKYNIAFLVLGLTPALLITRWRTLFQKRDLYFAAALALLIISPNLIWQIRNDFPVVHHMQLLAKYQLTNVNRLDFLKDQVLYFFGGIYILIASLISFFRFGPFRRYRPIFWTLLFVLAIFTWLKAKGYYAIGLYPAYLAFGAVYLERLCSIGAWRWLRPVMLAAPVMFIIPLYHVVFPVDTPEEIQKNATPFEKLGLLRWEDGKNHSLPQDFADMLGWRELAEKTDLAIKGLDLDQTLVVCDNYGEAGAINYYSRTPGMEAFTTHADYINWISFDREWENVILVVESKYDDDPDRTEERPLFDTLYVAGKIENPFAREFGTTIYVLKGSRIDLRARIRADIEEEGW